LDIAGINAGVGVGGLFVETDLDAELNMVSLNCAGTVHLAKYVVQHMMRQGEGKILFTASIAGEMVAPREAVYAATKAFVLSFAHSLRYELRDSGISVTALQPGPTDTDFFHRAGMDDTEVGSKGKSESQPDDVARQGIDALLAGDDHVYAASMKTKLEGKLANVVPGAVKGAMHEKMAKPLEKENQHEERSMALLNEAHIAGNAPQGATVIQDGRYLPPPEDKDGKVWVRTSAIIQAAPDKLYALWRDIESAPHWQEQLKQVIKTGERTSHWVMYRGDKTIEWDSELLADEPGKRLAWRSIGGEIDTAGEVVFEPAPTGRGTMVTLLQEFKLGRLANMWETLTGRNPKQAVIENLRHFKALAETGEIPRTQGQPHGPRGIMGSGKASAYGEKIAVPDGTRQAS
jgi:uncharacterized membrane protein